jgi:hypothetical protein
MVDRNLRITRRRFLSATAATAAAGIWGPHVLGALQAATTQPAARPRSQALYGLPLLGDLHYDQWAHHDLDWVKAEKAKDLRQIEGYVKVTETHTPQLFQTVKTCISGAPVKVPAVVQVGDFVEGLCGSQDLQSLQFRDAMAFVEKSKLGAPFLLTKGNHDITGPGAREAFDDVLLPWMSTQCGSKLNAANYTWRHGRDLFVFFDAYKPDLDWLDEQSAVARDARHVFFVIHPPVVPYNARANWHVFDRSSEAAERTRLLAWLGKHTALVLSGHLHRYALLTRVAEPGPFVQFAINSVVRNPREVPRKVKHGLADYNADLLELEPNFSPKSRDERRAWIEREKPHIRDFDYARVPGYAMLWVYDDAVEADVYLGHDDNVWKQVRLSGGAAG